jgi:histidinol-phosphate phosphatase family protein
VSPAGARLLPGAAAAIRALNDLAVPVVVVTNQRGLATGRLTSDQLASVHLRISQQLAAASAFIDGWYVCPHDEGECSCRKPAPGLLRRALDDRPGVDPGRCVVIGDQESDVLAGRALGIPGILLNSGDTAADTVADAVYPSLHEAVAWLLHVRD